MNISEKSEKLVLILTFIAIFYTISDILFGEWTFEQASLFQTTLMILFNYKENVLEEALAWEMYDLLFLIGYLFIFLSAFSVTALISRTFQESKP